MNTAVMGKKVRRNVVRRSKGRICKSGKTRVRVLAKGMGWFIFWSLILVGIMKLGVSFVVPYRWVTTHDFFTIANLDIQGSKRLNQEDITALSGVDIGENIIAVNIAEVQRRIAASPWVQSVSVTRVLPDRLSIDIAEREPAFVMRYDGRLYYADEKGQAIAAVDVDKFTSLPFLEKDDGVPVAPGIHHLLDEIARNGLPFGMRQLAWLRQDSAEQFSLFLENPRIFVQVDGTDLDASLACLVKFWADLDSRGELARVASMFVMPGRAWVRLKADQTL